MLGDCRGDVNGLLARLPNGHALGPPTARRPLDGECLRNGQVMLDELKLHLAGEPMRMTIDRDRAAKLA